MLNVSDELLLSARILIVDDEIASAHLIRDVLGFAGYKSVRVINDPRGVLSHLIEFDPDLILLDLNMPYMDGFQVLELISTFVRQDDYLPIMVLTANHAMDAREKALTGGAMDFLLKPFEAFELRLRVNNLLRLRFQHRRLHRENHALKAEIDHRTQRLEAYDLELKEAQLETIFRLARAAEHHDEDTGLHTQRVAELCAAIAASLRLPETEIDMLRRAAPLHDVGKIGIPDSILLKPGTFTGAERKIMQMHCKIGADLLAGGRSELLQMAEQIAWCHHERWDGTGYPRGLKHEEIGLASRIISVADVWDALTHQRPYKTAWPVESALAEIRAQSGKQFDPDVVEAFLQVNTQLLDAAVSTK